MIYTCKHTEPTQKYKELDEKGMYVLLLNGLYAQTHTPVSLGNIEN